MTADEFNRLDIEDQLKIIWETGVLDDHNTGISQFYLVYKVYDFFVEIAFDKASESIIAIRSYY
ncbi:MAG TPA: hypothetical protein VI461_00620, partial [Chitinophagaceae bacterium]|nr:hypothetical protein [Chitinophagaceae bacterium]